MNAEGSGQAAALAAERVDLLYAQLRVSQAVACVNAVVLAVVQSRVVDARSVAWWLSGLLLVTVARYGLWLLYARASASSRTSRPWGGYFFAGALASAVAWGSAAWLLYSQAWVSHQVFVAFVLGGMVAGSVTVLTPVYRVFALFAFVTLLPIIVRLASGGDELHYAMAGMTTIFLAGMLVVGRRIHAAIDQSLRLRFENRDLIAHLQGEKALLESRVSERTAALQALDRRKNDFLAMLSHELRNPLAPIRNSVFFLKRADPASPQARQAVEVIDRQSQHVTQLVNELLDVSRIERGKVELRREPANVAELVHRTLEDHRSVFERLGIRLREELRATALYASLDRTRMAQVIGNLLQNAAKFTPAGGEATVTLTRTQGWAEIRVRDTGIGIEDELRPLLFQPFTQGARTLARTGGGMGLGLAMVKGIVAMHGGTVAAESCGPDQGAVFIVRLPLIPAPPHARADEGMLRHLAPQRRRRVLVVDDNRDAADSLSQMVELFGHAAEVAYDGPSAIAKAQARVPDVVLCDLGLPGISGYEMPGLLRAIRDDVQLVAVSGYAMPEDITKAIEAGFDAHVAKPPDPEVLRRLLEG